MSSPSKRAAQKFKPAGHTAWRRVEQEAIILDLTTSVYYSLNESGAFVWERLQAGDTPAEAAEALSAEFDVTPAAAKSDVDDLVKGLVDEKLLTPA